MPARRLNSCRKSSSWTDGRGSMWCSIVPPTWPRRSSRVTWGMFHWESEHIIICLAVWWVLFSLSTIESLSAQNPRLNVYTEQANYLRSTIKKHITHMIRHIINKPQARSLGLELIFIVAWRHDTKHIIALTNAHNETIKLNVTKILLHANLLFCFCARTLRIIVP